MSHEILSLRYYHSQLTPSVLSECVSGETRVVHLDVENCSEELLRQQSYGIKNQLWHLKPPFSRFGTQNTPIGGILLGTR